MPLAKKWERRENCWLVMFDEVQLDPACSYYGNFCQLWDQRKSWVRAVTKFQSISVFFFKLKRGQEIAVVSNGELRCTCHTANWISQELNIKNIHDSKQGMKQHKGVWPFTSIIKDQIAEAWSLTRICEDQSQVTFLSCTFGAQFPAGACALTWACFQATSFPLPASFTT